MSATFVLQIAREKRGFFQPTLAIFWPLCRHPRARAHTACKASRRRRTRFLVCFAFMLLGASARARDVSLALLQ